MSLSAWGLQLLEPHLRRLYGARKRELLRGLSGQVLEIGAGTGLNRSYLAASVEWIPLEPDPGLRGLIQRRHPGIRVLAASAESLPLPNESVDAVLSSLVLCSVDQPERALAESVRVLRPGGCLVLLEHVAAPPGSRLAWWQHALQPAWTCVMGGCHPDRDTELAVRRAGFRRVELEGFRMALPLVSPHVAGRAWK